MSRFWSDIVHQLTPYTPGEQPKIDNLVKLNTNENPYGPSPKVIEAIAAANHDGLRKYPDPNAGELKQTIANHFGLSVDSVFVGNSSDEVLAHVFRGLLKQDRPLLFPDITYSFYPVYCALFDIAYQQVALRDDFSLNIDDYSADNGGIIFANPNAPTGIAVPLADIKTLLERHSSSVIVVDEAYVDFGGESAVSLIVDYPNLVVTQTLSKSRGLAGLRVGFALANPELIEGLERIKNSFHPYTLDALALAGAQAAFLDVDYFEQSRQKVIDTRERTTVGLQKLGFTVLPSSANFVFAAHQTSDAGALFMKLRERGIVVRYFDKERLSDFLRISIGTDTEMQQLLSVLADILSEPAQ
ncbi:histidinol-phosphate transaminase [Arenicella xantha]|uniref:Histidinol-phosphate aminotransferase n=1 Tax=Arenicella xantha TaxID=644221 RepID=A0A395JFR0_9GAMM|nr:histidinol-phosphate transaminase [Arenicella xantha]RBP48676.1 histidinol-phosphate aminotransferase [Arenicella xantha]